MTDDITPGANRLRAIDPEKLLLIDVDEVAPLLALQYAPLVDRGAELTTAANKWLAAHTRDGKVVIIDDDEMNKASDLFAQLRTFAGKTGEVEDLREKIGKPVFRVKQAIDAWCANLRDGLLAIGVTIDKAQNARADVVRKAAQAEANRIAQETQAKAQALLEAARAQPTPEVIEQAMEAEAEAEEAAAATLAPSVDLTRTRSAIGVTTSQSEKWDFSLDSMRDLCAAVAKGDVPVTFVMVNEPAVRQAIKGKHGMRTIAGLKVFPDYKINRRGA